MLTPNKIVNEKTITKDDYLYCSNCYMIVDKYKYDNLKDAGHYGHVTRELDNKEFAEAKKECIKNKCFKEVRL